MQSVCHQNTINNQTFFLLLLNIFYICRSYFQVDLFNIEIPYYYNATDKPYDPIKAKEFTDSWGKKFARVLKELKDSSTTKFPKITLYDIRHAYARRLIKLNVPTATASKSMGNGEDIFTRTYLKAMDKRDMAYIQKNL